MEGDIEYARLHYIIRDHDRFKFEQKKSRFEMIARYLNERYGAGTVSVTVKDSYYNMKEKILPVMHIVDRAKDAMREAGMDPVAVPIRGGTDGARLSFEGLPCPNLCTGGENFHGRYEYIPVEDMEQCVAMLKNILRP
jgi:tripeptide aminopeptidase